MNQIQLKQKEWRDNPALFIKEAIDDYPRWDKQIEALESVRDNRNTYIKAGHGIGKTFCAADIVVWFLLSHYPSKIITTAPSFTQVEKLLWAEVNSKVKNMKLQNTGLLMLKTEARFNDTWFAIGLSPRIDKEDAAKRLTGFHSPNILVVFDEGPSVAPTFWEIKETILTSSNAKFLAIGNPIGEGAFKQGYSNPNNSSIDMSIFTSPNFVANKITCLDDLKEIARHEYDEREGIYSTMEIPMPWLTTVSWAVDRLLEWGEDSPLFEARVLGVFPRKTTDTIISYTECEEACADIAPVKHINTLGVDIARFGDDFTVIYGYKNGKRDVYEKVQGQDLVKTANKLLFYIKQKEYRIVVIDDTGLGGGVTDILMNDRYVGMKNVRVMPVNFAEASSRSDVYDGVVTEMYFNARDHIREKNIQLLDEGDLIIELSSRRYVFDNKGRYKIEKKDDFKKRIGKSPDEADAFVLCLHGMFQPISTQIESFDTMLSQEEF